MARDDGRGGKRNVVIIRREEVIGGGHHGGAWKVAYADFVTAMMAFFLLMWLLNATTEEQRKGLADYFSPTNVLSHNSSGTGQPFSGHTAFDQGALVSDRGALLVNEGKAPVVPDVEEDDSDTPAKPRPYRKETGKEQPDLEAEQAPSAAKGRPQVAAAGATQGQGSPDGGKAERPRAGSIAPEAEAGPTKPAAPPAPSKTEQRAKAEERAEAEQRVEAEQRERQAFEKAAQQIKEAVQSDPGLAPFARQLSIDMTPEGLRVQILDEEKSPMFANGSAVPNDRARLLLQKVAPVLGRLSEGISISGHTDATPYRGQDRSNWELSVERANATRRALLEAGLGETRIRTVTGSADRDPLLPEDPTAAANRRIAIVVLRSVRPATSPAKP